MKKFLTYLPFLLLLVTVEAYSQMDREDSGRTISGINQLQGIVLNQAGTNLQANNARTRRVTTTVRQIGNYNTINANVAALAGAVDLNQFGNTNNINMDLAAAIVDQDVFQLGANHQFISNSSRATLFQNATVYQRGANQKLIMQGNNSMSQKMIVNMRGRDQTVFIRNFR